MASSLSCQQSAVVSNATSPGSEDLSVYSQSSDTYNGVPARVPPDGGRGDAEPGDGASTAEDSGNGEEILSKNPVQMDSESVDLDVDSAGVDDTDLALVNFFYRENVSLLTYSKDKKLYPNLLVKFLEARSLQEKKWDLDEIDESGCAVIHYIVMKSGHQNKPALLEKLVISGADVDLTTTHGGLTALHLAVKANDLDCVGALISLDADVNMEDFMGNTPLDLVMRNRELFQTSNGEEGIKMARLDHGATSFMDESLTASESAALSEKRKRSMTNEAKVIKLLESVGATKGTTSKIHSSSLASHDSVPPRMTSDGHYEAAEFRKINTVHYRKMHDDINKALHEDVTPDEAVKVVKIMKEKEGYRRQCGSRVLCLDGGGIRGLTQMTVLREIERQTKKKVVELFDWIVGTSTGGIIALSLTYSPHGEDKKTVRQLRDIYWVMKDEIFGASQDGFLGFLARGNTEKLEATLKGWLGEDVRLNEESYPKVLIPAVFKKETHLDLHFFNNCFGDKFSKELVWKVGRYTSAAPFYFTEFENYIDGGMLANNPSEAALTVIQDYYHEKGEKIPICLLVSVGSGLNPGSPLGEIDIKKNLLNRKAYLDLMEVLENAVLGKQTASSCLNRCREQGIDYFRFNPELQHKVDANQKDSQILREMILTTRRYLREETVKKDMDRLVTLLNDSELTST